MKRYLAQRLVGMLIVMFLVLTVVFVIVRIAPGDPASLMLGPDATAEEVAELRDQLGLNRSILTQYVSFMGDMLRGDLGTSIFFNKPVVEVMLSRAEPTIFLTIFSLIVAVIIAVPIGIVSAYSRGSIFDQVSVSSAMLIASIPAFWTGLIMQQYLGTKWGLLPVAGYGAPDSTFWERMTFLIMPALVLGIVNSSLIMRFTRASMLDVLSNDYIRTARSKGMTERKVVLKHALKNALIPIVTIVGLAFALLISGAVIVERVFNLPGVGSLVVGAVLRRDYPTIQGTLVIVAGLYVIINFLIDMIYLLIDPRVKY